MSIVINEKKLTDDLVDKINKDLTIQLENTNGMFKSVKYIYPFEKINDNVYLPFTYSVEQLGFLRPTRKDDSKINVKFEGKLRDEQKIVKKEALEYLNKNGSIILSLNTGAGKTITSINIACNIKLKTLVVVNKLVLVKQWEQSIYKFCPTAKVQNLVTKSDFDMDADFYIMNAINIPKMGKMFFRYIQTLIVDEVHLIMAEKLSNLMLFIQPRYLIGLSATPERYDGLNILLDLYFGTNKIVRKLYHKHTVFKINTGFKPKIEKTITGKVNWNVILESQSQDEKRNQLIIDIVQKYDDRIFLILVKRLEQGFYLYQKLKDNGQNVASLLGSEQEFDRNCRILIGTSSKVGVGFDFDKLNALILACDIESYFIQFLGRVARVKDNHPLIFDLVDKNSILEKHFNTRKKIYTEHGGTIQNLSL